VLLSSRTKGARALNTSATKFEVPLHMSEREEQVKHEHGADGAEKSLKGRFPSRSEDRYNAGLHRTN